MVVLEVTLAGGQQALLGITCNEPWIMDTLKMPQQKISRGAPLRGRCTPAIPARLRSERARKLFPKKPIGFLPD
jgi:hypothetical protein